MEICRACLVTNVKMYSMHKFSIFTAYLDLTGISDIGVYTHICYECMARLRKCEDFRSKCFKAHETLIHQVTKEFIQKERKNKSLESPLKLTNLNVCEYNDSTKTNDNNNLDFVNIKIESEAEFSNPRDILKYEIINQDTKHEFEGEDNNIYCDFDNDILYPNESFPTANENHALKKTTKTKKRKRSSDRKVVKKRVRKVDVDTNDDEPLSNLCKTEKKTAKSKVTPIKAPRFDVKSFEEYATVIPMTTEEARREVELRKETSNYKNCPLKCNLCYRGYELQNAYNNHMKKHSLASGKHECEVCHLRFPKRLLYSRHMFTCHKRKFCCKSCPYICFSSYQATLHMNLHKGVKYTCDFCQEVFSMPNSLHMHKRIKHPTEVVCALCGSTFATNKGLKAHNALIHKQETNNKMGPQCIECDVHFATETAWKRHLVLSAKHKIGNGCETCGETFPSEAMLKSHAKSHARIQRPRVKPLILPAACTLCDKWLTNRVEYKKHMTSQHPDSDVTKEILAEDDLPCVCEFCGKRFKKPCNLVFHQRKHTSERPDICNVCGKRFPFPDTLTDHKKTHEKRVIKCEMCDKVFKSKSAQIKHVKKTHLNIRPHSCDVCGKSFLNPSDVKYHKQHVHGNVPWPKRDRSKRNNSNEEHSDFMFN